MTWRSFVGESPRFMLARRLRRAFSRGSSGGLHILAVAQPSGGRLRFSGKKRKNWPSERMESVYRGPIENGVAQFVQKSDLGYAAVAVDEDAGGGQRQLGGPL
jgi:hypothetical protein